MNLLRYRIGAQEKSAPKNVYARLSQAYAELEALTNSIPGGVARVILDIAAKLITIEYASDGFFALSGYTRQEYTEGINDGSLDIVYKEDMLKIFKCMKKQVPISEAAYCEYRLRRKDGTVAWIMVQGKMIHAEDEVYTVMCVFTDITTLKKTQQQLEIEEERYRIVADISDDYLFEYDIETDTMIFSEKYAEHFGVSLRDENFKKSLLGGGMILAEDHEMALDIYENLHKGQKYYTARYRAKGLDGEVRWYAICFTTIFRTGGAPIKSIGKITNIDAMKKENDKLREKAQRDSLTKLSNKMTTRKMIEQYIKEDGDALHAVIMIDIDNFKLINDTCGHMAGDYVLTEVSIKLKNLFRSTDVVGRIGGDEFLVMLRGIQSDSLIEEKAEAICNIFRSIQIGDKFVTGSVGISTYPADGKDFDTLVEKADTAVYAAKRSGKDCYSRYEEDQMTF